MQINKQQTSDIKPTTNLRTLINYIATNAVITTAIRLRYDYDPTTTYRAHLLPIRRKQKMNMPIFRRSRIVVVSQSNRNCDIGLRCTRRSHSAHIAVSLNFVLCLTGLLFRSYLLERPATQWRSFKDCRSSIFYRPDILPTNSVKTQKQVYCSNFNGFTVQYRVLRSSS